MGTKSKLPDPQLRSKPFYSLLQIAHVKTVNSVARSKTRDTNAGLKMWGNGLVGLVRLALGHGRCSSWWWRRAGGTSCCRLFSMLKSPSTQTMPVHQPGWAIRQTMTCANSTRKLSRRHVIVPATMFLSSKLGAICAPDSIIAWMHVCSLGKLL